MKTMIKTTVCALAVLQCIDSTTAASETQNLRATWGGGGGGIDLGGAISSLVQNCLNGYGLFNGGGGGGGWGGNTNGGGGWGGNANVNTNTNTNGGGGWA